MAHSLRIPQTCVLGRGHGKEGMVAEAGAAGHVVSSVRKQRQINASVQLTFSFH